MKILATLLTLNAVFDHAQHKHGLTSSRHIRSSPDRVSKAQLHCNTHRDVTSGANTLSLLQKSQAVLLFI